MLPNFFIVGAPKAGTDDLYYQLDQHPQIYVSPLKEPCFFSSEIRAELFDESLQTGIRAAAESLRDYLDGGATDKRFGGIITRLEDYERLFLRVGSESAIGEGSVCYLWSSSAASNIAANVPDARIIIVLMDPAERAYHQYLKSLSDGNVTHSFRTHLDLALRAQRQTLNLYHPFLDFGCYAEQVRRYTEHFPAEQIHISLYEDRLADPAGWFRRILQFLGVDDSFVPRAVDIPSRPRLVRLKFFETSGLRQARARFGKLVPAAGKSKIRHLLYKGEHELKLLPEDRAVLVRYYQNDILELQRILRRDLSTWLQG